MTASLLLRDHTDHSPAVWTDLLGPGHRLNALGCRRFPTTLLAALAAAGQSRPVDNLSEPMATALRIVGAGSLLGLEPITASRLPFTAHVLTDGTIQLRVSESAPTTPVTSTPLSHEWAGFILSTAMEVDLSRLVTLNSVVIAWLLQLGHSSQPAPVRLVGANRQVIAQLRQLRLDQVLTLA